MHTRGFQSVKKRSVLIHSWYAHKRAFLQSPRALGANVYSDSGYLGEPSHTKEALAEHSHIEGSLTDLAINIVHRISARLHAHSLIRL
jgi:hypothetical protein